MVRGLGGIWWLVKVVVIVLIGTIGSIGCDTERPTTTATGTPIPEATAAPLKVSASWLTEEYLRDRSAANKKYKGRRAVVNGTLADIPSVINVITEDRSIAEVLSIKEGPPYKRVAPPVDFMILFTRTQGRGLACLAISKGEFMGPGGMFAWRLDNPHVVVEEPQGRRPRHWPADPAHVGVEGVIAGIIRLQIPNVKYWGEVVLMRDCILIDPLDRVECHEEYTSGRKVTKRIECTRREGYHPTLPPCKS